MQPATANSIISIHVIQFSSGITWLSAQWRALCTKCCNDWTEIFMKQSVNKRRLINFYNFCVLFLLIF